MLLHIMRSLRQQTLRSPPTRLCSGINPLLFPFEHSSVGAAEDPKQHPPKAVPVRLPRAHRPPRARRGTAAAPHRRARSPLTRGRRAYRVRGWPVISTPGCLEAAVIAICASTWKTPESFCWHLLSSAEVGCSLGKWGNTGKAEALSEGG